MTRLDFDPDLERLGEALHVSTTIDLAREERGDAPGATRTRRARLRPRVLAGSTLGLVGVGAALVLALGGSTAAPAFAITNAADGSVLVKLNYNANENLPQVNAKLAAMGLHERVTIFMASGAASVGGPVTCTQGAGATKPVKVLVGTNGTETISAGQSAGNTAEGTFHLVRCVVTGGNNSATTGNTGNG
jgi:hypothetical protein